MPWPMRIGFFWDEVVCECVGVGGRVRMSPGMTNVSMSCSLTCILCVVFFVVWIDFCFKFFVEENSWCWSEEEELRRLTVTVFVRKGVV